MTQPISFLILPKFDCLDQLAEFYARLCWYVSPFLDQEIQISVIVDPSIDTADMCQSIIDRHPSYFDQTIPEKIPSLIKKTQFIPEDKMAGKRIGMHHVLVWHSENFQHQLAEGVDYIFKIDQAASKKQLRLHNFDVKSNRLERVHFVDFFGYGLGRYEIEINQDRFESLVSDVRARCTNPRPVIIGKPPSKEEMTRIRELANVFILTNMSLHVDHLSSLTVPTIITFMDAVMPGCSVAAQNYRSALGKFLTAQDHWALTCSPFCHFLRPELPTLTWDRLIEVPMEQSEFPAPDPNINLNDKFVATATWNVLTGLAMPLAAALSKEVLLYGIKGKSEAERVWSPTVSGVSDNPSIKLTHPSQRNEHDQKYEFHEKTLTTFLNKAEREGYSFVSLSPSHFAEVQSRYEPLMEKDI